MRARKLPVLVLVLALTMILGSRPAHADGGGGGEAYLGAAIGLMLDVGIGVGSLASLAVGAVEVGTHHNWRGWRIANYVFGVLNLAAGITWGALAASGTHPDWGVPALVPQLALGGANFTVAIISSVRASRGAVALRLQPMNMRDGGGRLVAGIGVQLIGF
jgi:hypothetical protein